MFIISELLVLYICGDVADGDHMKFCRTRLNVSLLFVFLMCVESVIFLQRNEKCTGKRESASCQMPQKIRGWTLSWSAHIF